MNPSGNGSVLTAAGCIPRPRVRYLCLSCTLLFSLFLCLPQAAGAQNPILPETKPSAAPAPQTLSLPADDAAIDKAIEQLEERLKKIRALEGTSAEGSPDKNALQIASPDELRKRRHMVSELIVALDAHAEALRDIKNIRKVNRQRSAEIRSWEGFAEKPPYPVVFLDSLRDAVAEQKNDIQTLQMRLSIITGELNKYIRALNDSRPKMRLQEEAFEKSIGSVKEGRQRWLRDMARLQNELNETAVASFETRRLVAEETLAGKKEYLQFLEQKLRAAERVSPLSAADVGQKLQALDSQRRQIAGELARIIKKEEEAKKSLQQTREKLEALQSRVGSGAASPFQQNELKQLQTLVELQTVLADGSREQVEVMKGRVQLIDYAETLWEDRLWLARNPSLEEIRAKSEEVRTILDNLQLWKTVVQSRMLALVGLIQSQRARIDAPGVTAEILRHEKLVLRTYEDRHILLQKAAEELAGVVRLAGHFSEELAERRDRTSLQGRLRDAASIAYGFIKKLWLTELYVAEETVVVEGARVVKPVTVTVAKAVQALAILVVGVWISRKLMRPLRWLVVHKFKQNNSIAAQIGTVAFLILFIAVFVFSLVSVNIPLAVFAFLGGALAIGIGFGAQNLINNFISGIILLFDRSISVGDLIEVDGQGGKVTAIGMRSSLVQRFDGVEMLVPNSQFLQQKVINWTHSERQMRYSIAIGVAYGSPVRKVKELLTQVIEEQEAVLKTPHPLVVLDDFADNCIHFTAYFWLELDSIRDNRILMSEMRFRIIELFDEHGIVIPFPQRDVHLDAPVPIPVRVVDTEADQKGSRRHPI